MKNGTRGERGLITTILTLIQMTGAMEIGSLVLAPRTPKTVRPSQLKKVFQTGFFSLEFLLKLQKAQTGLLHFNCPTSLFILIYYSKLAELKP